MPELSRFFGIVIRMFAEAGGPHHLPNSHAYHQGEAAVFGIEPVDLPTGSLGIRQRRLVEAWAELHQAELLADWKLLQLGKPPLNGADFDPAILHDWPERGRQMVEMAQRWKRDPG